MRPAPASGPCPAEAVIDRDLSDREYDRFSRLVYETSGIVLNEGKRELLRARVGKILRLRSIPSFGEYLKMVEGDASGEELTLLLDAISTNVTSFFREADHFRFIEQTALPQIAEARRRTGTRKIRVWSAACSTGEEPYSIGITLLDSLQGREDWDARILATDLSTRVLAVARNALYAAEKVKTVPPEQLSRHFTQERAADGVLRYRVKPGLRGMVTYGRVNLLEAYPFKGPFDFIFCRNVMIYFNKETQATLINGFRKYLADGGYLFVGHSESLNGISHPFRYVRPSVYRKPGGTPGGGPME